MNYIKRPSAPIPLRKYKIYRTFGKSSKTLPSVPNEAIKDLESISNEYNSSTNVSPSISALVNNDSLLSYSTFESELEKESTYWEISSILYLKQSSASLGQLYNYNEIERSLNPIHKIFKDLDD